LKNVTVSNFFILNDNENIQIMKLDREAPG